MSAVLCPSADVDSSASPPGLLLQSYSDLPPSLCRCSGVTSLSHIQALLEQSTVTGTGCQHGHLFVTAAAELCDSINDPSCYARAFMLHIPKEAGTWEREMEGKIQLWWCSSLGMLRYCLSKSWDALPLPTQS